jgi:N-acetylglucosaminyl-diphospho-decaprenol L-rhamnosyltransferase
MPARPLLSIIVVSWNVRDLLRTCLASLERGIGLAPGQWEVIVVDNASGDGSAAMVREAFPRAAVIESPANVGFGAGCNLGQRAARGEFILLLNPDTEVIDGAIDGMLETIRARPRAGILAPRLVNGDRSFQMASGGALPTLANVAWNYLFLKDVLPARLAPATLFLEGDPQGLLPLEWVSGAAMLLRREAVGEPIFDEAFFMYGEDMDLCRRVRAQGWEVLYTSEHSIVHHDGRSFARQPSLAIRASAHDGPRRVFARNRGPASVLAYDAILLAGFLTRWPLFRALAALRPGRGYGERADFARTYVRAMFHRPASRGAPGSGAGRDG